jgi:hypothetical protein
LSLPRLSQGCDLCSQQEIGPNDYLKNLSFGILTTGEARKGLRSVFTDIIYGVLVRDPIRREFLLCAERN